MQFNELVLLKVIYMFKIGNVYNNHIYFRLSTARNKIVSNFMVGVHVAVYNGKVFIPIKMLKNMLGVRIGSLSFSHAI